MTTNAALKRLAETVLDYTALSQEIARVERSGRDPGVENISTADRLLNEMTRAASKALATGEGE